jgi:hypothetical protein
MKPRSAKSKGKRLQNTVRDLILEHFPQLEPDDVVSTLMGDSGTDIKLSPAARKVFPYAPECKNTEKLAVWAALEQAEKNAKQGTYPLLFFKRNRSKMYVAMEVEHFFQLITKKLVDNSGV